MATGRTGCCRGSAGGSSARAELAHAREQLSSRRRFQEKVQIEMSFGRFGQFVKRRIDLRPIPDLRPPSTQPAEPKGSLPVLGEKSVDINAANAPVRRPAGIGPYQVPTAWE